MNIVLTLLLVPPFGIAGAAAAWAVAMLIDTVAAALQVRYLLGLRLDVRRVAVTGLWALAWFGLTGVALRTVLGTSAPVFVLYAVVACAGYAATLWRLRHSLGVPSSSARSATAAPDRGRVHDQGSGFRSEGSFAAGLQGHGQFRHPDVRHADGGSTPSSRLHGDRH
ncbi:polysaccharide biosynthesis C-terminal domain-containing protein [Actinomadura luteofluorescens]|uniref:polysaccharide biosynthesis C-terminal domain-containing protein n=1 Tax=Actinomadura luteofluorescens TaxID=46163 RepID=UPI00362FDFFA